MRELRYNVSLPVVAIGMLSLLAGCTSKQISTSVADQAFEPGQPKVAEVPPPPPAPAAEEARVTEAPAPPPPPPPAEETRVTEAPAPPPPPPPAEETRVTEAPAPPPPPPPAEEPRIAAAPTPSPSPPPPPLVAEQPAAAVPVIELVDAYFDFDRFVLRQDARTALESNARILKSELNGANILLEGHCDEVGTAAYNLVLGEKRARAAARYLEDLGVSPSRIQIASYGKERPACTEHSPDCWQKNRRVHFAVK